MTKSLVIWTAAYSPFILGGNVNAPIATEVEVGDKPIEIGHGISVYVIVSPNATIHIAEATTGALVGTDLAEVIKDVGEANPEIMKQQLAEAGEEVKKANHLSPDEFWRRMARAK